MGFSATSFQGAKKAGAVCRWKAVAVPAA